MRIIILFLLINLCTSQLYTRIPFNEVEEEVFQFIYKNHLNNCFRFKENMNTLRLKCLNNQILYDVRISMKKSYEKPDEYLAITI